VVIGWLLFRRNRQAQTRAAQWRSELAQTLPDAKLTRDLLDDAARTSLDANHIERLQHQVDATADALARLASTAPAAAAREQTQAAEQALRGYIVAIETEQMASQDRTAVADDAVPRASDARRTHARALDEALARLDDVIRPEPGG
jgi:hypothetical protein